MQLICSYLSIIKFEINMSLILFILLLIQSSFPTKFYRDGELIKVAYGDSIIVYNILHEKIENQYSILTSDDFEVDSYVMMGDYFVHSGGGIVFQEINSSYVKRIDKSYDHKLQLGSILFDRNDTLFKYGGYGFFSDRNFFTYYDKKIDEWETLRLNGDVVPVGVYDAAYFLNKDFFIFFGGSSVDPLDRSRNLSNRKIYQFDFNKRQWTLKGESDNSYRNKRNTIQTDRGVIYFSDHPEVIDFFNNSITVIENNPIHRKIAGSRIPPFFYKDYIYYLNSDSITDLNKISLSDFMNNKILERRPFILKQIDVPTLIQLIEELFVSIVIVLIIIFLFLRNKIIVIKSKFYYRFRILKLDPLELKFLQMLLCSDDQRVSNQVLLNLFDDKSLDLGTITRKKNQFVHDLNEKLKFLFRSNSDFLISEKSNSDRRNTFYFIDKSKFLILSI